MGGNAPEAAEDVVKAEECARFSTPEGLTRRRVSDVCTVPICTVENTTTAEASLQGNDVSAGVADAFVDACSETALEATAEPGTSSLKKKCGRRRRRSTSNGLRKKARVHRGRRPESSCCLDEPEGAESLVAIRKPTTRKKRQDVELSPSEMTLWDLVVKNRRIVPPGEAKARKRLTASVVPQAPSDVTTAEPLLDSLFNDGPDGSSMSVSHLSSKSICRSRESLQDLFGPSDPLLGASGDALGGSFSVVDTGDATDRNRGASLSLDAEGNLLLEEASEFDLQVQGQGTGSLMSLFEGRTLISENFGDTRAVQPFSDAYKVTRAVKWSREDEATFYEALETFGLDLMMVRTWLPHFTARQIRDKYRIEEKRNEKKIDQALQRRRPVTTRNFESIHGQIDASTHFHPSDEEHETQDQRGTITTAAKMPQLPSVSRVDDVLGGLLGEVMLGESDMAEEISEQREAADSFSLDGVFDSFSQAAEDKAGHLALDDGFFF